MKPISFYPFTAPEVLLRHRKGEDIFDNRKKCQIIFY